MTLTTKQRQQLYDREQVYNCSLSVTRIQT